MFKKIVFAALALSFIGAPLAQAKDNPPRKPAIHKAEPNKKARSWSKGQRYNAWRNHTEIKDYKRYGLRQPGRDQRWIKVDNQYLLVAATTGLIIGVFSGR